MLTLIISILQLMMIIKGSMARKVTHNNVPWEHGETLDIYCATAEPDIGEEISIIMYVHGGGWVSGNNEWMNIPGLDRAEYEPFPIVAINYGLAGENNPEAGIDFQLDQIKNAVQWIKVKRAKKTYGSCLDYDEIVCFGESAGGHLCSLLGTKYGSAEIDKVVDYYGPTDFWNSIWNLCPRSMIYSPFFGKCGESHYADYFIFGDTEPQLHVVDYQYPYERYLEKFYLLVGASPAYVAFLETDVDVPPFFIAHCKGDEVVHYGHSLLLYDILKNERHYDPIYVQIPGGGHALDCLTNNLVKKTVDFLLCRGDCVESAPAAAVYQEELQIASNLSVVKQIHMQQTGMAPNASVVYGIFIMMASFWACF